jgi:sarcosine oxidase subunit beta
VVGLSIAWHLRVRGIVPLVIERQGIAAGASGVQPGGVRQQWGTSINCKLARESVLFWREAQNVLDTAVELGFRSCGYVFLAHSEHTLDRLRTNVEVQNAANVPSRIIDSDELAEIVPGISTASITGAAWCEEDGYFDRPQSVVEAFAPGIEIRIATVVEIRPDGREWELTLHDSSRLAAGHVVVAAAADSVPLLRPLGVELPITEERRWLFLGSTVRERLLEPLVVSAERHFAAKQLGDGRVLASDLSAVADNDELSSEWRASVRRTIRELLPILEYIDFSVLVPGIYDVTPDRQAIIGAVPGRDGVWIAAGFSGHGFMLAPAVGRILADAIAGGENDKALDLLGLARFAEGRQLPEPQVV